MSLIRKPLPASPAELQDQLRSAQAAHAQAVAAANQQLVDSHNAVLSTVVNRRQALAEQIELLTIEREELAPLVEPATKPPVAGQ